MLENFDFVLPHEDMRCFVVINVGLFHIVGLLMFSRGGLNVIVVRVTDPVLFVFCFSIVLHVYA